jgi:hypothetical protein
MKNIFTEEERLYRFTQLEDINFARTLTDCELEEFKFLFRYFNDTKFREIEDTKEERTMINSIDYKGKTFLFLDHSGKADKELLADLLAGNIAIEQALKTGDVFVLANFENTYMSEAAMEYLKSEESININKRVKKTAVIGVLGVKKILLKVFNKINQIDAKTFDRFEDAREYLVS